MEIKNFDLKIFQKSSKAENLVNPKISSVKHFILKTQKIQDYSKLCVRQENKNDIKIVQVSSKLPPKPKKAMSVSNESIFECSIKCEKQQPKKKVSFFDIVTVYQDFNSIKRNKTYRTQLQRTRN